MPLVIKTASSPTENRVTYLTAHTSTD